MCVSPSPPPRFSRFPDSAVAPRAQRGVTLIEAIATIGVMAAVMTLAVATTGNYTDDTRNAVTAQQIRSVGEAARAYINDNQASLSALASAAVPAVIPVSALVTGGYLPSGFSAVNNHAQTMCVLVLEPTANNLQGLVITQGGTALDDITQRQISNLIGASGGSILSTATTTLDGSQGGWSMALGGYGVRDCSNAAIAGGPGAGHNVMALWTGGNDVATAFLYRDSVAGRPELNRMNTSIDMGGFRIVNLQTAADNTACGAGVSTGDLARDASGKVLSCQTGLWKTQGGGSAFWGDPVDQAAAMPACTAANANETRVRYGYATAPTRRLFTCDGAAWQAVGVDHAGNMTVPGDLAVGGTTTLTGAVTANGAITANSSLTTNGAVTANSSVTIGDGTAADATNTLVVNRTATEGGGCAPNGAVARDATGLLLSCQSLLWKKATGSAGGTGLKGVYAPHAGKTISCKNKLWFYATIGADGTPYLKIDTGAWTVPTTVYEGGQLLRSSDYYAILTASGLMGKWIDSSMTNPTTYCYAAWPLT